VDFTRRAKSSRESELQDHSRADSQIFNSNMNNINRRPASAPSNPSDDRDNSAAATSTAGSVFEQIFDAGEPVQDIVILGTDHGFIPSTVRVRRGGRYMIHVVNVNEKEKNVSFILDAFSERHAIYYGKIKSFKLEPKKEGIFSFQSPETSFDGRLVVFVPQVSQETGK
jgi:hypothetical protein